MTAELPKSSYRPDIDGLRAIAVVSVLLFHADVEFFGGGFLGVDVFFVISGFLITKILRDGVIAGTFSYGEFYLRRARRLFPALFVTIAITFVIGAFLLIPYHLERLGAATFSSLFWFSNILFWSESGYFDTDALYKPLLHTWSLSVEEQFYLFWPTLIVLLTSLKNPRRLIVGVVVVSICSLVAAEWIRTQDSSSAFFLVPFRIYEFGVGAVTLWFVEQRTNVSARSLDVLCALGLALVGICVVFFSERTGAQGVISLVSCLGAVLILFAGTAPRVGTLISNRPIVYVGRISYSLYLVHWPVVVFYRYRETDFTAVDQLLVILFSFLLAIVLHHFVENPLRRPKDTSVRPHGFLLGAAVSALLIAVPATHAWTSSGWSWRWDVPAPILKTVGNFSALRDESWAAVRDVQNTNTATFDGSSSKVLLIGDSHSKDLFNAMYYNLQPSDDVALRRLPLTVWCVWRAADSAPPPQAGRQIQNRCSAQAKNLYASSLIAEADWIVLSQRWSERSVDQLAKLIQKLRQISNAKIAVAGRTAEFPDIPLLALEYGRLDGFDEHSASVRNRDLDALNAKLSAIAADQNAHFIDKYSAVCVYAGERCSMFNELEDMLIYDEGHWTLSGARYYGRVLREAGAFVPLGMMPVTRSDS